MTSSACRRPIASISAVMTSVLKAANVSAHASAGSAASRLAMPLAMCLARILIHKLVMATMERVSRAAISTMTAIASMAASIHAAYRLRILTGLNILSIQTQNPDEYLRQWKDTIINRALSIGRTSTSSHRLFLTLPTHLQVKLKVAHWNRLSQVPVASRLALLSLGQCSLKFETRPVSMINIPRQIQPQAPPQPHPQRFPVTTLTRNENLSHPRHSLAAGHPITLRSPKTFATSRSPTLQTSTGMLKANTLTAWPVKTRRATASSAAGSDATAS